MTRRKKTQRNQSPKSTVPAKKDDAKLSHAISQDILERLPDETRIAIIEAESFKGPLPPPSLFGNYEEILPGSAERILTLAEKEQSHRQNWEMDALTAQKSDVRRGQWMGFGLGMTALIVALLCAYFGFPIVAAASISTVLAGIITAFLKGRSNTGSDE